MQDYYVHLSDLFKGKLPQSEDKYQQASLVLNSITRKFFIKTGKSEDEATVSDFLQFYTNFNDWGNMQNFGKARQDLAKKLITKIQDSLI